MKVEEYKAGLTEDEKRKLIVDTLDKSLFIEAGAGAGKTSLIESRIVNQLRSGVAPEKIVVITFTNAATRELQGRILKAVQKAYKESKEGEAEHEILKAALDGLDRMHISTIHGLCHRILTEKCFEADLAVGFDLMDKSDEDEKFESFFVNWMEQNIHKEDWDRLQSKDEERWKISSNIMGLAKQIYREPSDVRVDVVYKDADRNVVDKEVSDFFDDMETYADKLSRAIPMAGPGTIFRNLPDEYLSKYGVPLKKYLVNRSTGVVIQDEEIIDTIKALMTGAGKKSFLSGVTKSNHLKLHYADSKGKTKLIDDAAKEIAEKDQDAKKYVIKRDKDLNRWIGSILNPYYAVFVEYAEKCAKEYRKQFPSSLVTNDLLLQKTKELLEKHPEVREYFANKFDCYYVDEFQDTDHVQDSFIKMLAEKPGEPGTLRDGALFLVGDPKQSIYRFRGAEPKVYFDTKEALEDTDVENAIVISLQNNYRSNENIIEWVNDKFEDSIDPPRNITDGNPYTPMVSINKVKQYETNPKLLSKVYCYSKDGEVTEAETDAKAVCEIIKKMIDNNYQIAERNSSVGYRSVNFGDFLLISGGMKGMDIYADEMSKSGIPFVMDSKIYADMDYYINAFVRMYAFLADPYDLFAKEGALEVLEVSGADNKEKNKKILEELRDITADYSAYGCLEYLLDHMELIIHKDKDIEANESDDLVTKLTQMTELIKASECGSRQDVLGLLKSYAVKELERELVLHKGDAAVRFMNLHKAKGLEGGIVIWVNRRKGKSFQQGRYKSDNVFYPSLEFEKNGNTVITWHACTGDVDKCEKSKKENECEHIRLEYVAATRAKQALIFMDPLDKSVKYFDDYYNITDQSSIKELLKGENVNTSAAQSASPFVISKPADEIKEKDDRKEQAVVVYSSESPSDYEDKSGDTSSSDSKNSSVERPKGRVIGLAMHRTFELMVERFKKGVNAGFDEKKIPEFCMRQALNEMRPEIPDGKYESYHNFLNDAVYAFGGWMVKEKIYDWAEEVYTELPFSYKKSGENNIPVWMHGEADLIIKCKDGSIRLYDYKSDDDTGYSDQDFEARLQRIYGPQIRAYKEMISRLFKVEEDRISAQLISFSYEKDGKMRPRVTGIE